MIEGADLYHCCRSLFFDTHIMKRFLLLFCLSLTVAVAETRAQDDPGYDTTCVTQLKSLDAASLQTLSDEMLRLKYLRVVACKSIDSDLHKVMKTMATKLTKKKAGKEEIVKYMGKPYFAGTLADYEGQKVTVGRGGKPVGTFLPPMFQVPSGDSYVVYLWYTKEDYLVFALKQGKVVDSTWWHKP